MARKAKEQELIGGLEPAAAAHGLELVEVELLTVGGQAIVRVYLEPADESGSISIDILAEANAWVDPLVEAIDPYPGAYTLEVSSPGIDRPLRTLRHFARFQGETVKLRTEPIDGRSNWTGQLAGIEGEMILLELEDRIEKIAWAKIKKAHIQGSYFSNRKGQ
ncbi:MAG: ribosome maturation factor RimP [Coriobacteriales bacterium]|jgi:ribosome maturation factor RimP|nr:ribosome maturation factor RimP [Coriobacteriales bacterium]